ncbi:hypothetical protein [Streptomyces galilaeus]|uniref:hypothetical protein n=1 Tax=Streptomyces galilaeus TaxID=33899 RepID=UPI00167523B7|nr:hypothetical protein [Streptomyces galilaeus]GGW80772.1 hypothetical protein GCM10010350_76920 [Streptomyces galilaeus]
MRRRRRGEQGDKPLPEAPQAEEPGKVLDLMAALTESVSRAKAARGETGDADVHDMPKKKTAAKKTAKKTPAKKTTQTTSARRTAGRRPRSA